MFSGTSIKHMLRGHVREHLSSVHSRLDIYNTQYEKPEEPVCFFFPLVLPWWSHFIIFEDERNFPHCDAQFHGNFNLNLELKINKNKDFS